VLKTMANQLGREVLAEERKEMRQAFKDAHRFDVSCSAVTQALARVAR